MRAAHYAGIDEQKLPAELIPNFTTIEYTMKRNRAPQPVFLYVVDTVTHPSPSPAQAPLDCLWWIVCDGLSVTVLRVRFLCARRSFPMAQALVCPLAVLLYLAPPLRKNTRCSHELRRPAR